MQYLVGVVPYNINIINYLSLIILITEYFTKRVSWGLEE